MSRHTLRIPSTLVIVVFFACGAAGLRGQNADHGRDTRFYAPDASHLWNRVHQRLFVRTDAEGAQHGVDEIDPLLWRETTYLLTEPSHAQTLRVLDEFLQSHGERLIVDPIKRAVFQRDLWAVFDWANRRRDLHADARRALSARLARMIRRVALTKDQIAALPDNYAAAIATHAFPAAYDAAHPTQPFLPREIFDADGPWIELRSSQVEQIARQHGDELSRSTFSVFVRTSLGPDATRAYFKTLWDYPQPFLASSFVDNGDLRSEPNAALPELPDGAQVALVRQTLLIDNGGEIVPTNLAESVQLRVFHAPRPVRGGRGSYGDQEFFEFRLSRPALFSGIAGGLTALGKDDTHFITFSSQGFDAFDGQHGPPRGARTLDGCVNCHAEKGIQSMRILPMLLKPRGLISDARRPRWSRYNRSGDAAARAKTRRYDWGVLQGLWDANPE